MAVRVRVRVSRGSREKALTVLVSGGAESEEPVIVVKPEDAKDLGFTPEDFDIIEVELASSITQNLISREKVKLELLGEEERVLASTYAYLAVDEELIEPLITDATIDELGIIVLSFKKGLWRHISDPPDTVRRSVA
jgi:hypothetical protein